MGPANKSGYRAPYRHVGQLVNGNVIWDEGKEDNDHSQQIKLNNLYISLRDKRMENPYPISTAASLNF